MAQVRVLAPAPCPPPPFGSGGVSRPTLALASGGDAVAVSSGAPSRPASVTGGGRVAGGGLSPPLANSGGSALHDALLRSPSRAKSWQHVERSAIAGRAARSTPPLFVDTAAAEAAGTAAYSPAPATPRQLCENCCAGFSSRPLTDDPASARFCCLDCMWSNAFRQQDECRVSNMLNRIERAEQQEHRHQQQMQMQQQQEQQQEQQQMQMQL
jgi:hypothetical protein